MSRQFIDKKLLLASNNPGKLSELAKLLAPYEIEVMKVSHFNIKEPEETGLTFEENAKLKAEYFGKIQGMPALADSGLSIEALGGFPGIYSARFAGDNGDYIESFNLIEKKLAEKKLITSPAFFICSLALWWPDGHFETFEGKIHGNLSFPASGGGGFGYDPIFIPNGYSKTFSEFNSEEKNKISHRALAFNQMIEACFS